MIVLLMVLTGLLIGSFLNVVAIRVLRKESIAFPPSHCVKCNHRLHAKDLVPVFSYLWLRGRCRYCREPISIRYPVGELATGGLFSVAFLVIGLDNELLAALFFISILLVITQTDLEARLIPNVIVITGLVGASVIRICIHPYPLWNHFVALFVGSGILLVLGVIGEKLLKREAVGGGDVKLYAFIGVMLGIPLTLFSLFAASVFGLLYYLLLAILNKKTLHRYMEIPFGPFIAAGALFAYFFGQSILDWYFSSFLS